MDGRTERRTDGGDNNIPFAFLKKRGDNYDQALSLKICKVEFHKKNLEILEISDQFEN